MAKRILIITYYWPPSGGSGVLRWVKMTKYLYELGYEPVIYTADNADYPVIDESIADDLPDSLEVIRQQIWEPYDLYRKFTGKAKEEKFNQGGFTSATAGNQKKENLALWIRSNFFIPDARRFWVKPSVSYLKQYLMNNPVDYIITTGPPHSLHLIGMKLKKIMNIPWIADFRDPWTKIYYYPELPLIQPADALHHHLEKKVLKNADSVITVGKTIATELEQISKRYVKVVHNGYDHAEMPEIKPPNNEKFRIIHTGNISRSKNQPFFWKVLSYFLDKNPGMEEDLEIVLAGTLDYKVDEDLQNYDLEKFVTRTGYLPHHETLELQQTASLLLLMISDTAHSKGVLTGKLFEYLASEKPVIAIAPENSDLADIIRDCKAGEIVGFGDKRKLTNVLSFYYEQFQQKKLESTTTQYEKFSRIELTKKFSEILKSTHEE
ncbi:MAG: glycosyltransferase family 4 protein [Bacteroidales bacterium]